MPLFGEKKKDPKEQVNFVNADTIIKRTRHKFLLPLTVGHAY